MDYRKQRLQKVISDILSYGACTYLMIISTVGVAPWQQSSAATHFNNEAPCVTKVTTIDKWAWHMKKLD